MVNAPVIARERGIEVGRGQARARHCDYNSMIFTTVTDRLLRAATGGHLVRRQASAHRRHQGHRDRGRDLLPHILYITNDDKAGLSSADWARWSGREQGQGRNLPSRPRQAGAARPLRWIQVDQPISPDSLWGKIAALEGVAQLLLMFSALRIVRFVLACACLLEARGNPEGDRHGWRIRFLSRSALTARRPERLFFWIVSDSQGLLEVDQLPEVGSLAKIIWKGRRIEPERLHTSVHHIKDDKRFMDQVHLWSNGCPQEPFQWLLSEAIFPSDHNF